MVTSTFGATLGVSPTLASPTATWSNGSALAFGNGVTSSNNSWGQVYTMSCASAGDCVAAGEFNNSSGGYEAFVARLSGGVWGQATPVVFGSGVQRSSPFARLNSVSCASVGNCVAVGGFTNSGNGYEAFVVAMSNGVWGQATLVAFGGLQASNPSRLTYLQSVSCPATGECVAVGQFKNASGNQYALEAFTVTMSGGVWGSATPATYGSTAQNSVPDAIFYSVSCASTGNCVAAGGFWTASTSYEAMVMTMSGGTWAPAVAAVFPAGSQKNIPSAWFNSVSCGAAGSCTAVGSYRNALDKPQPFTMTLAGGSWGQARPVVFVNPAQSSNPNASLLSVSCSGASDCTAVGRFANVNNQSEGFETSLSNGTWSNGKSVQFAANAQSNNPDASLEAVSCASAGNCAAGGFFKDSLNRYEGLVVTSVNVVQSTTTAVPTTVSAPTTTVSSPSAVANPTSTTTPAVNSSGSVAGLPATGTSGVQGMVVWGAFAVVGGLLVLGRRRAFRPREH